MSMQFKKKQNLALVLSGGGIKAAAFHLGVCLALKEKGFIFAGGDKSRVQKDFAGNKMTFKIYVGSSAGAVISSILAAGYSVEAVLEAFERGSHLELRRRSSRSAAQSALKPITYFDLFHLNGGNFVKIISEMIRQKSLIAGGFEAIVKNGFKINGLFKTKGIEKYLRQNVLKNFNEFGDLGVTLRIIATQLNHSRKVVFGDYEKTVKADRIEYANYASISQAVAASASLPPVFAPYPITNHKGKEIYFFDGEIRDTLSTHVAAEEGADLVLSSYSIQPYHYTEKAGSLHRYGIPLIMNQALYQVVQQKIEKSILHHQTIESLIETVHGYFRQAKLPEVHREKLIKIMCKRANYRPGVDYLYIHPDPRDYEMFFVDHFSLNAKTLSKIVQIGFRSAMHILRPFHL